MVLEANNDSTNSNSNKITLAYAAFFLLLIQISIFELR